MSRGKKYRPEEIIPKLREAEVLMSQGMRQDLAAKRTAVLLPPTDIASHDPIEPLEADSSNQ